MAKFPIRYAQADLGPAPALPRANLDVRTGEQQMWMSLVAAGERLSDTAVDIIGRLNQQERNIADSEARLRMDDIVRTYHEAAAQTGDPAAETALREKAENDIRQQGISPRMKVVGNQVISQLRSDALAVNLTRRDKELDDRSERVWASYLEQGDIEGAKQHVTEMVGAERWTREEGVTRLQNLSVSSALAQARRLIALNDSDSLVRGAEILASIDPDQMSAEQLEQRNSYMDAAKQQLRGNIDSAITEIIFDMSAKAEVSAPDKLAIATEYKQRLAMLPMEPSEARVMVDRIDRWATGTGVATNPEANMRALAATLALGRGEISEPEARERVMRELAQLSNDDATARLGDIAKAFDKSRSAAIQTAYTNSRSLMSAASLLRQDDVASFNLWTSGLSEEERDRINRRYLAEMNNRNLYNVAIQDWVRENSTATPIEIRNHANDLLISDYQPRILQELRQLEADIAEERAEARSEQEKALDAELMSIEAEQMLRNR